ncbi:MAG: TAXI family TRAP transporter solute-binding subunit [Steroidobacteraceae bacterium]|jgi:TRAP transporter TAXI family solute receptor|nr:TAXI family TRAP transporter solute-binding subunit [Steroidobacteraceae bacterium]
MERARESFFARYRLWLALSGVAVLGFVLWFAADLWRPLPTRSFVMATGVPGGAYEAVAKQYRDILARDGITLELRPSEGATENLGLLLDPDSGVKAAFVQGGAAPEAAPRELVSLGAMFYEPMWLFVRREEPLRSLAALKGLRVSIGKKGSGSHVVAIALLRLNGIAPGDLQLVELAPNESADQLEAGQLDAAFMTIGWEAPAVRRLLSAPGILLEGFPRADAYVALYPFLSKLTLPMGVADLATNRPPEDVTLVATKAMLVVRRDLHPALQYLLMHAAMEIHGRPGVFQAAGQFPSAEEIDLPLSEEARHFYLNGPSFLKRHLPFWMAEIAQRILLVLVPLVGILYPLWSGLPQLYRWEMQHRIYRLYGELKWIERELREAPQGTGRDDLLRQLAALEDRANRMRLPNAYAGMGYTLKMHIRMAREALFADASRSRPNAS